MGAADDFDRAFQAALGEAQQEAIAANMPKLGELIIQMRLGAASWREITSQRIAELGLYPLTEKDHRALMAMIGREVARSLVDTSRREAAVQSAQSWSTRSAIVMIATSILAVAVAAWAAFIQLGHH